MITVVFDTVIFVRCLINPHSRCGRLVFSHAKSYRLVLSEPLIREIIEVLHRPELKKKFPAWASVDMNAVLDILGEAPVVDLPEIPPVSRDPKDDHCIATALATRANYIVSEDTDLLVIKAYKGIRIVDTESFLSILET